MQERTKLGEQIGPTIYAEEYGGEAVIMTDGNVGQLVAHVAIRPEDARVLVNMLRCRLNAICY
jgi:hypothetical protein